MKILAAMLVAAAPLMAQYGVRWEESLAAAKKRARAEKKLIMLDIWAECRRAAEWLNAELKSLGFESSVRDTSERALWLTCAGKRLP